MAVPFFGKRDIPPKSGLCSVYLLQSATKEVLHNAALFKRRSGV